MSRDLNARLVIGGDASGASRALSGLEAQMNSLQRAGARLQAAGAGMKDFGQGALVAGGVAGAVFAPLISNFAQFEESTTRTKLAFMEAGGTTSKFFESIKKEANDIALMMPGSIKNVNAIAVAMKTGGMSDETILSGGLRAGAYLKNLFNLADAQAGDLGVSIQSAFKIDGADFKSAIDVMQRTSFGIGVSAEAYTYALKQAAPILGTLNVKGLQGQKEFSAVLSVLKSSKIEGEQAGTALTAALNGLSNYKGTLKSDKDFAAMMRNNNIELAPFDVKGKFVGIPAVIAQMEQLRKLSEEDQIKAANAIGGGQEGGKAILAMIKGGIEGYNKGVDAMANQATLNQRFKEIEQTLASKWESAMGNLDKAFSDTGGIWEDTFKGIADWIGKASAEAGAFATKNASWVKWVGYGVAGFAALAATAGVAAIGIGTISSTMGQLSKGAGFVGSLFGRRPKPGETASPAALGAGQNVTPVRVMNWGEAGALGKGALTPANGNAANQVDPKKTPTPANGNAPGASGALETDPKKPSLLRRAAGGMGRAGRYGGLALAGMATTALLSAPAEAAEGVKSGLDGAAMIASESATALQALSGSGALIGKLSGAVALLGKVVKPADWALKAWDFGQAAMTGDMAQMGASGGNIGGGMAGAMAGAAVGSIVPVIGTAIGGLIGGIAGSMAGEAGGGWLGRQASALFGAGKPEDKKPEEKKGGWFSGLFGSGKAPDLSLPKTPALTEIVSREGIRPGPGMGAAQVTAPISITVNANGASPEVAAQVAKAVQDQSADIVRMITDHFERQRRVSM